VIVPLNMGTETSIDHKNVKTAKPSNNDRLSVTLSYRPNSHLATLNRGAPKRQSVLLSGRHPTLLHQDT